MLASTSATHLPHSLAFYQLFVITKGIGLKYARLRLSLKDLCSSEQSTAGSFVLFCCLSLYSAGKFCLCACQGTGSWHGPICPQPWKTQHRQNVCLAHIPCHSTEELHTQWIYPNSILRWFETLSLQTGNGDRHAFQVILNGEWRITE